MRMVRRAWPCSSLDVGVLAARVLREHEAEEGDAVAVADEEAVGHVRVREPAERDAQRCENRNL